MKYKRIAQIENFYNEKWHTYTIPYSSIRGVHELLGQYPGDDNYTYSLRHYGSIIYLYIANVDGLDADEIYTFLSLTTSIKYKGLRYEL